MRLPLVTMSLGLVLAELRLKLPDAVAIPPVRLAAPIYWNTFLLDESTIQISLPSVVIPVGCETSLAVQKPLSVPVGPCTTTAWVLASICQSVSPAALAAIPRTSRSSASPGKNPLLAPLDV